MILTHCCKCIYREHIGLHYILLKHGVFIKYIDWIMRVVGGSTAAAAAAGSAAASAAASGAIRNSGL